jgi:hypothetical protein
MSPRLSLFPTVRDAESRKRKSGRRASSMGVGTVMIKKSAARRSSGLSVRYSSSRARSAEVSSFVRS